MDGPNDRVDPAIRRLFRHFASTPRGRNVFLLTDGTVTETQPANWNPDDPTGVVNTSWYLGQATVTYATQIVRKVFWGGCANPITADEQAILTAAGYGPYIS